jgi:predicted RNA-binding Zn-ribbon protein involved in translation (DUF1610 family)
MGGPLSPRVEDTEGVTICPNCGFVAIVSCARAFVASPSIAPMIAD